MHHSTPIARGCDRSRVGSCLRLAVLAALCALALPPAHASADAPPPAPEAPDPTRLDVERLPPEAIALTRDMFAHGPFVYGELGARGFAGGLGRVADPGVMGRIGFGIELTDWLLIAAAAELSLHETVAPPPPQPGSFQVLDAIAEIRLRWPMTVRAALWLGGEAGVGWVPGNLLPVLGIADADSLALIYGGSLGFDWHLLSKHHTIGLRAGARLYPGLAGDDPTIGIHATAQLAYVF
jgi:hypothetical protein